MKGKKSPKYQYDITLWGIVVKDLNKGKEDGKKAATSKN